MCDQFVKVFAIKHHDYDSIIVLLRYLYLAIQMLV